MRMFKARLRHSLTWNLPIAFATLADSLVVIATLGWHNPGWRNQLDRWLIRRRRR